MLFFLNEYFLAFARKEQKYSSNVYYLHINWLEVLILIGRYLITAYCIVHAQAQHTWVTNMLIYSWILSGRIRNFGSYDWNIKCIIFIST